MSAIRRMLCCVLTLTLLCAASVPAFAVGDGLFSFFDHSDEVTISQEEYESLKKFEKLAEIMDVIDAYFYEEPDKNNMLEYAIWGMLQGLGDDYTFYYNPERWQATQEDDEGSYAGVGIQMLADYTENTVTISRVFKNTPAEEAGLKKGDILVRVDELEVTAETMSDAANLMRGKEAETVEIEVIRAGEHKVFTVGRRQINVNRVEYKLLDDQVGLIILYEFAGECAKDFDAALKDLRSQGATSLVVDLRDNGGGWVDAAEQIADLFLDRQLLFYAENRFGEREEYYTKDGKDDIPLVVMVNGNSASASEILAGSLQAAGRATLVGTQSYGKGIMQLVVPLSGRDGKADGMQVTFAQYFMPNGQVVHKIGLTPDTITEMPEELVNAYFELGDLSDPQLKVAVDEAKRLRDEVIDLDESQAADAGEDAPMYEADWSLDAEDFLPLSAEM